MPDDIAAATSLPRALSTQALTHVIAHSLRTAGFTTASARALHTLSAAAEVYLSQLACLVVSNAQDVSARRLVGVEDVLRVMQDEFVGIGDAGDVKRFVEREIAGLAPGNPKLGTMTGAGGVGNVLVSRARRYRATGGKVPLEMNEQEVEDWFEREEEQRRAAAGAGGVMLSRMSGVALPPDVGATTRRGERGTIKGLEPLRVHNQEGLPTEAEKAGRPVLHSVLLPPPGQFTVEPWTPAPRSPSPSSLSLEDPGEVKKEAEPTSPSQGENSPRGIKRRRSSPIPQLHGAQQLHHPTLQPIDAAYLEADAARSALAVYDEPYLPPLPDKLKMETGGRGEEQEEETIRRKRYNSFSTPGTGIAAAAAAGIAEPARRTPLDIYTSGAIPYDRSTLAIAYDVSHLTAMEWRKPRSTPPPLVPSVVPSLVKAYHAAKSEVLKAPPSKSSRSFKIAAADVVTATVGHPLLHVLAGTTNQVPGTASGSGTATPRGNPFVPSYPIWAKTGLPVNEAHERDRREKEVYPVKPLAKTSAPLPPTMALNVTPSPAIFNPHRPELLRTLITEMAGHPLIEHSSRSGWLRPSALRQFTTIQPPDALKVDAATAAADRDGELRVGMPYLYGDAVRAPGQLGSMDAKMRAARAKDRRLKASAKVEGSRKLKLSFSGGAAATNAAAKSDVNNGLSAEQIEAEEALLKDRDEIMLRATWPTMDESRGDWQELMEPVHTPLSDQQPPPPKILAFGTGYRLSDILPPALTPAHTSDHDGKSNPATAVGMEMTRSTSRSSGVDRPSVGGAAASADRKLVFRIKRPGEVTPISESPPLEAGLGGRADGGNAAATATLESRPGLKFKLKLPIGSGGQL